MACLCCCISACFCCKSGPTPEEEMEDMFNRIPYAAKTGDLEQMKQCVAYGVDINKGCYYFGLSALHYASMKNKLNIVEYLISIGADICVRCPSHYTPLHYASVKGHCEVMELLAKNGADVNTRSDFGQTPLHSACESGHFDAVKLLVRYGADINAMRKNGSTPLHSASSYGFPEIVEFLLDRAIQTIHTDVWAWNTTAFTR